MSLLPSNIRAASYSIVIFRALQLGDLLCAVPAWRALRRAYPQARIVLVGLPWAAVFADRFKKYFDAFVEFPGYPGLPERPPALAAIPPFLQQLQADHFDLALQMHGDGTDINALLTLFGAQRTAGFYLPGRYCPDEEYYLPYPAHEPEVWRHLRLMERLGISDLKPDLEFPLNEDDYQSLYALIAVDRLRLKPYVCLHPGARAADRRWPPERFAIVGDALTARGFSVVLTGTDSEAPVTQAVAAAMHHPAIDLAGRTSLGVFAALLSMASLLVSNDTGAAHIADALNIPSVIIAGFDTPRWAPLNHDLHRVVYDPAASAADRTLSGIHDRCWREACRHVDQKRHQTLISSIPVEAVMAEVDDLIQPSARHATRPANPFSWKATDNSCVLYAS